MARTVKQLTEFRESEGKRLGLERALTFEEAAARVGANKTSWHAWEHGRKVPAAKFMPFVCALVGCSSDIFYGIRPIVTPKAAPIEAQPLLV